MNDARNSFGDRPAHDAGRSFASEDGGWAVGSMIAQTVKQWAEREQRETEASAQVITANTLARDASAALGIEAAEFFRELTMIPDNLLTLLHSPEGWSALTDYVAQTLGKPSPIYEATIH